MNPQDLLQARSPETPVRSEQADSATKFPVSEWLLVLVSFAIFATVRSPVPGVNEPHYLTKARHFWDPSWCSRDPFLQSANAHLVFYATVGVLTKFCSLTMAAWLGRIAGWMLLSSGWTALAVRLLPFRWAAVWSAWVFLLLAAFGNWSGEWVVGGIEAKVLSYGCGWWSLACALTGRTVRAAAWSGAAVSFHPVVGIWNTLAVVAAILVKDWRIWRVIRQLNWKEWAGSGLAWLALAGPGLFPALAMVRSADPQQAYQADYIQVYHRLAHHLDPWHFSLAGYIGYVSLLVMSLVLYVLQIRARRSTGLAANDLPDDSLRWQLAARYVLAAILIALSGIAIRAIPDIARVVLESNLFPAAKGSLQAWANYGPKLAGLLKFYPFRLADVAVPWVASLLLVQALCAMCSQTADRRVENRADVGSMGPKSPVSWAVFGVCFIVSLALPSVDRNPSRLNTEHLADWENACQWVQQQTPEDALCFSVNEGWALKWFAKRADYLSFKDCPQDAAGIIAWNDRFKLVSKWSAKYSPGGYSPEELRELRRLTQIDYLIVRKFGPLPLVPVYHNANYQVYRLPE